jgi:hypothetical protein
MLHVVMAPALLSKPKIIFGGQTKLPSETTVSTTAPRQMLSSTYGEYNSPVRVLQIETRYPIRYYAVGSEVVCWSGTKQQQKLVVLVHKRHSQDSCETVSCSSLQTDFVSRACLLQFTSDRLCKSCLFNSTEELNIVKIFSGGINSLRFKL